MATSSSYVLFLKSPCSPLSLTTPLPHNQSWFQSRMIRRTKPISTVLSVIKAQTNVRKEDIVIVGAGIAGLATALSLHRLAFFELHVFFFFSGSQTVLNFPSVPTKGWLEMVWHFSFETNSIKVIILLWHEG